MNEVLRTTKTPTDEVARARPDGLRPTIPEQPRPLPDTSNLLSRVANTFQSESNDRGIESHLRVVEGLYRLTDKVGRAQTLDEVCEAAVDAIVEIVGVQRTSILMFDDRSVMRFRAWRGLSERYREAVDGHSPWKADAETPSPIVVEDVLVEPSLAALRQVVVSEGIRSLAFIPLVYRGRLLGKFMLYCDQPHCFSNGELQLAATIAHHVAFGIARAKADAAITSALHGEREARAEADLARTAAERVSRTKDEFLAMLAHELRNPLGVITTALAVLESGRAGEAQYERSRAAIRRQTAHLARLLDDLLDVSRITNGQIQLESAPVDLRTIIELGIENQRHRLEAKNQQLGVRLPADAVMVMGDSDRLQQVFVNLVSNASKYTGAGGVISVSLDAEGDNAVLRVRDNGAGIAPERLEWIFELFTQVDPTLARTEGGLGIGLTVAQRLVELHKGRIRAASEGLGHGTEVMVELPLTSATLPASAPSPSVEVTPRRILVIEDNCDGREMLVAALQLQGHRVFQAATGKQGIEEAKFHMPEVVLLDIGLPDIDGYAVAEQLRRSAGSDIRLVAITGYGTPADRVRSEQVGICAHLLKPVDPTRLAVVLEALR